MAEENRSNKILTMKYHLYATVTGSKYLGEVEADSEAEAIQQAEELDTHVSLCHQCSGQCEDPEIGIITAQLTR